MSKVLRRPLFRGGPVDPRGTGITSGLDDGRVRKGTGGTFFGQFGSTFKPNVFPSGNYSIGNIGLTSAGAPNAPLQTPANNPSLLYRLGLPAAAFSGPAFLSYINRPKTLAEKEFMQSQGAVDETMSEDELKAYFDERKKLSKEGDEISLSDALFMDPETGTYPKFLGRYDDIVKREKIKSLNMRGDPAQFGEDPTDFDEIVKAQTQAQAAATAKEKINNENEPTVGPDDLAALKKEIAGYEELLGVPKARKQMGYDALLRFAGAEGQDIKEKLTNYFREESKSPDLAQSKKEAAALLAIKGKQAKDLYSTKSMAELKDYMMKQKFLQGSLEQQYGELLTKSGKPDKAQFKGLALQNNAKTISMDDLPRLQEEKATGIFYVEAPMKEGTQEMIIEMVNGKIEEKLLRK